MGNKYGTNRKVSQSLISFFQLRFLSAVLIFCSNYVSQDNLHYRRLLGRSILM